MHAPRGDGAVVASHGKVFVLGGEMWSGTTSTCDWGWGPIECAVKCVAAHVPSRGSATSAQRVSVCETADVAVGRPAECCARVSAPAA